MNTHADACYRAIATCDARFDGRLFVAVRTTGIYCRPICPARTPKRENVLFYASAAAAQTAGFRPCLRCRPELSPDLAAWHGSSSTVSRAIALIESGALNDGGVERLAERLDVGGRQLRRLFMQHLGASPVAVAQTRRVFLAKQLIHDTNLTMTDVALASGFGSVRRFNETFQRLYGRPPATLRRASTARVPDAAAITIRLTYRPPYDWSTMHAFLAARAVPGVEAVTHDHYARTIAIGALSGTLVVEPGGGDFLCVTVRFPQVSSLPEIIARVRRVFDLAADPAMIGAHLSEDLLLAPFIAARPGLRTPGAWDGFELAVRAILGQQITVPAATRLAGRIVQAFGVEVDEPAAQSLGLTHLFPSPNTLAGAGIAELGVMPRSRAAALASLARAITVDPTLLDPCRDLESAIMRLRSLPGVGDWTAHYIAMRALRELDAFPAADAGLLRAMTNATSSRLLPAELLARADSWRPWRSYAAMHLWASLSVPATSIHEKAT